MVCHGLKNVTLKFHSLSNVYPIVLKTQKYVYKLIQLDQVSDADT